MSTGTGALLQIVRYIMQRYLVLRSGRALVDELRDGPHRTKLRRGRGGQPFRLGGLYHLLRNRTYVGEVVHRGAVHPGKHPPIVERTVVIDGHADRTSTRNKPLVQLLAETRRAYDAALAEPAIRFSSMLLGLVTLRAVLRTERLLGSSGSTGIGAILLACCQPFLFTSAVARNDALPGALLALGMVAAVQGLGGRRMRLGASGPRRD